MALSLIKKKFQAFELYTVDVVLGRRADTGAAIYGALLQGLSWIFNGIVQLRLWLYRTRIFHDQHLGCLVVVVGNLTVGGTGKTPVVEKFARALRDRGRKVAILSRGYKSKAPPFWEKIWHGLTHTAEPPPRIVSDGVQVLLDSEQAGDEPYMLARNLPGVVVLVDKNRVKAGAYAIKRFGCDTLVLDDGFQYLPLKGRLNLLLVDKTNPFGNGRLLPRGILREPVKHLKTGELRLSHQVERPARCRTGGVDRAQQSRGGHHRVRPQAAVPPALRRGRRGPGRAAAARMAEGPAGVRVQRDRDSGEL